VERVASKTPSRAAIIEGVSGKATSYADLAYRIGAASRGFKTVGVRRGTVVAVHMPNCPEFVVTFNALASLGAVITTSNPAYSPTELAHQFKDSGAEFVVTHPALEPTVKASVANSGMKEERILTLGQPSASFLTTDVSSPGAPRSLPEVESVDGPKTLLALPYSSGTTGLPKGVALSHGNLVANLQQAGSFMQEGDVVMGVLPMYHIYGIICIMGIPLLQGATCVTLPKFDPPVFLSTMMKFKTNFMYVVPPILSFLVKHPAAAPLDFSFVHTVFSGAAPLDADAQKAAQLRFPNSAILQGYGMTESSPITHMETKDCHRMGSIGKPVPDTQCRIVSTEDWKTILPSGEKNRGELQVKGPQVMMGYHNNAKATSDTVLQDGWLRTGDVAYQDSDGFFYIVDRIKELIKVKGLQVAPAELEAHLLSHPLVYDAAVVGKPDERAGELPVAFVVLKAQMLKSMGKTADADALPKVSGSELIGWVAGKTAEYKKLCALV